MIAGTHDFLFITLDTLRYDVAVRGLHAGLTPTLAGVLPDGAWEMRHSPATFTYAAHHAFFAGFLPTPAFPGRHTRRFAARFAGSETTGADTLVFESADIVTGFRGIGYHTICIGGVGFFNKQTALGSVLPALFDESHWETALSVTSPDSTARQVGLALAQLEALDPSQRVFLFINVSALHQPNCIFTPDADHDTPETQLNALAYVDAQLAPLFAAMRRRAPTFAVVCADHGTAYGEDGYSGHRLAHPTVWNVPYAEFYLTEGK